MGVMFLQDKLPNLTEQLNDIHLMKRWSIFNRLKKHIPTLKPPTKPKTVLSRHYTWWWWEMKCCVLINLAQAVNSDRTVKASWSNTVPFYGLLTNCWLTDHRQSSKSIFLTFEEITAGLVKLIIKRQMLSVISNSKQLNKLYRFLLTALFKKYQILTQYSMQKVSLTNSKCHRLFWKVWKSTFVVCSLLLRRYNWSQLLVKPE